MKKTTVFSVAVLFLIFMIFSGSVFAKDMETKTDNTAGIGYQTHIQNEGWAQGWVFQGTLSGSEGKGLRLEGIEIELNENMPAGLEIAYQTHIENEGWSQGWVANGELSGSKGKSLRLEAIEIKLKGENASDYSVKYRTHIQNEGWAQGWVSDGALSGSQGKGLRLEAIEIVVEKKPATVVAEPVSITKPVTEPAVKPVVSNYGLIPDDIGKKDDNARLLNLALNQYGSIAVDGTFYIGNTSEAVTNPFIQINGLNASEFIFDNGRSTVLFDPDKIKSLTISNMKFTNLSNGNPLFIVYNDKEISSAKVNRVMIDGCSFQGDISLYRQQGDTGLNPEVVDFGIDTFIFTNNRVSDTTYSFIVLNDIPFENIEISNNTIHNFQNVFANMGITNESTYEAALAESRKLVRITGNMVTCDDNWWAKQGSGSYYAFVLTENEEVVYDSNHVEGLKADFDVALYDAYLSSRIVTYTNNTWINNIIFNEQKENNALIKSKQGGIGGDPGNNVPVQRLYANNTFIVEESYAERLERPKSELFVYFMDLQTYAEGYTIENNKIDVYDIRFPVSSMRIKDFVFKGNDLKAKYALGVVAMIRLTDDYQPTVEVVKNNINIEQTGVHPSGQTYGLQLVQIKDARTNTNNILAKSIVVKDNVIHGPFEFIFYTPFADVMAVQNNKFNVVGVLYNRFVYDGNHPEIMNTLVAKY